MPVYVSVFFWNDKYETHKNSLSTRENRENPVNLVTSPKKAYSTKLNVLQISTPKLLPLHNERITSFSV